MDAALEYYINPNDSIHYENVSEKISSHNTTYYGRKNSTAVDVIAGVSMSVICILGLVGNGIVIWLLGFRIKRNPFTTYILNLAIADLMVVLSLMFLVITVRVAYLHDFPMMVPLFMLLFLSTYSTSQFFLTAISVDRCVAIFFPLWHRCHRPLRLSTVVCALLWFLSFLLTAITCTLLILHLNNIAEYYQFVVNALLCLPVMTIATVSLFIKVCFRTRQHRRGKLLTTILLTLLFFLLFAFPLNVILILSVFHSLPFYALYGAVLLACLNSSINPVIYILVGRQRQSRHKENMTTIFQRAFKEEEGCFEETPFETQL